MESMSQYSKRQYYGTGHGVVIGFEAYCPYSITVSKDKTI